MRVLFNEKTLENITNDEYEDRYRIKKFEKMPNTNPLFNGEDFLEIVHNKDYIERVKRNCNERNRLAGLRTSPKTYEAACVSVGLAIQASVNNDFALTRPPGHHAKRNKAGGFCYFNNIAIATKYLLGLGKKVAIVDFDAHHGNGTQEIFSDEDRVLYCSVHCENTYPNSGKTTKGNAVNINVPKGSGDDVFVSSIDLFSSLIKEFGANVIGVSAGFDGYFRDKLGGLSYTQNGFYMAGKILSNVSNSLFAVLEGGYHNQVYECVMCFVSGVNNERIKLKEEATSSPKEILRIVGHCTEEAKRQINIKNKDFL